MNKPTTSVPTTDAPTLPPLIMIPEDLLESPLTNDTIRKGDFFMFADRDFVLRGLPCLRTIEAGTRFLQKATSVSLTCWNDE